MKAEIGFTWLHNYISFVDDNDDDDFFLNIIFKKDLFSSSGTIFDWFYCGVGCTLITLHILLEWILDKVWTISQYYTPKWLKCYE